MRRTKEKKERKKKISGRKRNKKENKPLSESKKEK